MTYDDGATWLSPVFFVSLAERQAAQQIMILEWLRIHQTAFWWMGVLSLVSFLGTLLAIPLIVVRIPADYFKPRKRKKHPRHKRFSLIRLLGIAIKNLFGVIFVLAGVAMLVLPGQGIITILIGLMMADFPGKFALERRIIQHPQVLRTINWMRTKAGRPALQVPRMILTVEQDKAHAIKQQYDKDSA